MTSPTVFTTDRLLEFTSVNELSKLVGYTPPGWPVIAVKELIDNALDAAEDVNLAPAIGVYISTTDRTITVKDLGPGIVPDVVEPRRPAHQDFEPRGLCGTNPWRPGQRPTDHPCHAVCPRWCGRTDCNQSSRRYPHSRICH